MMTVTGGRAAREFARMAPLEVLRLPFASLRLVTAMLWRRRPDGLPAHRWMRGVMLLAARMA